MNEYDRREYPEDEPEMSGCVMVDQCANLVTGDLLYNFLDVNFDRHYQTNRAPLGNRRATNVQFDKSRPKLRSKLTFLLDFRPLLPRQLALEPSLPEEFDRLDR